MQIFPPLFLWIGSFNLSPLGIFAALGFILASFLLWRNLKEEYQEEEILNFTILIVLCGLIFTRIFFILGHIGEVGLDPAKWFLWNNYPGFSLPGGFIGIALFANWWSRVKKWNRILIFDQLAVAGLSGLSLISLGVFLSTGLFDSLLYFLANLAVFLMTLIVMKSYRKLIWYKSGKPGFTASFATGLFFLLTGLVDFYSGNTVYLDIALSTVLATGGFVFLYILSERDIKDDLAGILIFNKERKKSR